MRIHVVVRRQLRLDVRQRDVAPQAHIGAAGADPRDERFHPHHREVVAVDIVVCQQLITIDAVRSGVAVIRAVNRRQAETPVDVILLHRVRHPLEVQHELVELQGVRVVVVGCRRVSAERRPAGAEIAARIDPAVELNIRFSHGLAQPGIGDADHQRAIHGCGARHTQVLRAAIGPLSKGHGRGGLRCGGPTVAAAGLRVRVRRRATLAPFELVVIGHTVVHVIAILVQVGVETGIVFIGIAIFRARRGWCLRPRTV